MIRASLAVASILWVAGSTARAAEPPLVTEGGRELTVCADPNNLPFSNRAGQGFENKLVSLIAQDMDARLTYFWWAQRRGYARNTLSEAKCDLWPGVALGVERLRTTRPYYRSTYMFVSQEGRSLHGLTLDDERLKTLSIGVQLIGNDAMNTPPAHSLARRGLTDNIHGFMLYGNYDAPNPPERIVAAVIEGQVDVALVWGPLAGYFAKQSAVPLRLEPVQPTVDDATWPMTYEIAVGVRPGNTDLLAEVDHILLNERPAIDRLLLSYSVPLLPLRSDQIVSNSK